MINGYSLGAMGVALALGILSPAATRDHGDREPQGRSGESRPYARKPEERTAMSVAITDRDAQLRLLESDDPVLAANKRLVYEMYRVLLQGGHANRAAEFIAEDYIQHNPNVASGRQALVDFLKGSRPVRPLENRIMLPLVNIIAERDMVMVLFERPEKDGDGNAYVTSWFDLFRIENGMIAEHWDPALKSPEMLKFDPNTKRSN